MCHTLERQGLIESRPQARQRVEVKRYRITEACRRTFEEWCSAPCTGIPPQREEIYLKLAFGRAQHLPVLLESIAARREACVERLRENAEEASRTPIGADELERLVRGLIDEAVSIQLHAELEWLGQMKSGIESYLGMMPEEAGGAADVPGAEQARHARDRGDAACGLRRTTDPRSPRTIL
jgi:hypothetical protein